jgi:hypothetical protein
VVCLQVDADGYCCGVSAGTSLMALGVVCLQVDPDGC